MILVTTRSRTGVPCLWEYGGSAGKTGYSQIITNKHGGAKEAIFTNNEPNGQHALVPISIGDHIVIAERYRLSFSVKIYQITDIIDNKLVLDRLNTYSLGYWDTTFNPNFAAAITAARHKTHCPDCRESHYTRQKEIANNV